MTPKRIAIFAVLLIAGIALFGSVKLSAFLFVLTVAVIAYGLAWVLCKAAAEADREIEQTMDNDATEHEQHDFTQESIRRHKEDVLSEQHEER